MLVKLNTGTDYSNSFGDEVVHVTTYFMYFKSAMIKHDCSIFLMDCHQSVHVEPIIYKLSPEGIITQEIDFVLSKNLLIFYFIQKFEKTSKKLDTLG